MIINKKIAVMIDDIMDNFDFSKVGKVMKFLDWKVSIANGTLEFKVPDEIDLRKIARQLLYDAVKNALKLSENTSEDSDWSYIYSGPFKVTVLKSKYEIYSITLDFVCTTCDFFDYSIDISDEKEELELDNQVYDTSSCFLTGKSDGKTTVLYNDDTGINYQQIINNAGWYSSNTFNLK